MATKQKKHKQTANLAFNKKNTLAFADLIYTDKGGIVTLLKLCHGTLANGKDGGRQLHCAVGEAYHTFIGPNIKQTIKNVDDDHASAFSSVAAEGATAFVIDKLVGVAQLKKPADTEKLAKALSHAVEQNDDQDEDEDFFTRSRDVAEIFRKEVAPLLK